MKFKTRGAAKNLSLDISTWPPKVSKAEDGRPRTATLDKPVVLDIALLGHLDMTTLTRRGLLKVCRFPMGSKNNNSNNNSNNNKMSAVVQRKEVLGVQRQPGSRASSRSDLSGDEDSLASLRAGRRVTALVRQKKPIIEEHKESTSWPDGVSDADRFNTFRVRRNNRLNRTYRIPGLNRGMKRQPLSVNNSINNNISECLDRNEDDNAVSPSQRGGVGVRVGPRRSRTTIEEVFSGPGLRERVPEPCRTCGRPEQPERFHSHPKGPGPPKAAVQHHGYGHLPEGNPRPLLVRDVPEVLLKKTVKKPVPIKYRPRREQSAERSPARQAGVGVTHFLEAEGHGSPSRARAGPRIVVCYVCGKEFGTASLPLHEPHCVQRWLLQNSKLPAQWQRQLPQKPVGLISIDEWNKFAGETSKGADSVQCPNCLRRFCPDRINSHERVCFEKPQPPGTEPRPRPQPEQAVTHRGSPLVECYLCGKKFGTRSIGIHEPQCLKKWQQVNGPRSPPQHAIDKSREYPKLEAPADPKPLAIEFSTPVQPSARSPAPPSARPSAPPPAAPVQQGGRSSEPPRSPWVGEQGALAALTHPAAQPQGKPDAPKKVPAAAAPAVVPVPPSGTPSGTPSGKPRVSGCTRGRPLRCYLCGQMFGLQSLPIHEPQCLQKWRLANAKLPPHLQRPEPEKPEIIFTESGDVDYWGTFDRIWANHTGSLVACTSCGRSFFPDRILIHERSCINKQAK